MTRATANAETEKLLELAKEYRSRGYEVFFQPSKEETPDFLKGYRPDLIARQKNDSVVIQVLSSRTSKNPAVIQQFKNLARAIEQHSGWRLELVMTNPQDAEYLVDVKNSLQEEEIELRLETVSQLLDRNQDLAILYCWSLVEAAMRLVAEKEELDLRRFDSVYLAKLLATEGIVSQSEYQLLMDSLSFRNAIAHGFKTTEISSDLAYELVELTKRLLNDLTRSETEN